MQPFIAPKWVAYTAHYIALPGHNAQSKLWNFLKIELSCSGTNPENHTRIYNKPENERKVRKYNV